MIQILFEYSYYFDVLLLYTIMVKDKLNIHFVKYVLRIYSCLIILLVIVQHGYG